MKIVIVDTNLVADIDSYKASHFLQYPPGTKYLSSYVEARGVAADFPKTSEIVVMGTRYAVESILRAPIRKYHIDEAKAICAKHVNGVFNFDDWNTILSAYGGHIPLHIQALPEGSVVPLGTPLLQQMNTDERFPWLTGYIENRILRDIWYPTTVATLSREIKKVIKVFLEATADDLSMLDFMLHDFGSRGASSAETARLGGTAHLVNFKGTDTIEAIRLIRALYDNEFDYMPGFSIPAAEHSTITSWGRENEAKAYENMVDKFGSGLYAVVSDSYDIYNAVENIWGGQLKAKVIEAGGRLVIRPDSGEPLEVILKLLSILEEKFGVTTNSKGFKVLHPSVRLIQGDGVNYNSILEILLEMKKAGWAADNIVFGMGGALLQKVNRDSLKFAMKTSSAFRSGVWYDVFKDPVTDKGKRSKRGRLGVTADFRTVSFTMNEALETIYEVKPKDWGSRYTIETKPPESFELVRSRATV